MSAVTVVAALGFSGCRTAQEPTAAPSSPAAATVAQGVPQPSTPLPPPEALTAVMDRLADPAVTGTDKLALIQDSVPQDVQTLDRFAAALRDGGYVPAVFTAGDVAWSESVPREVVATVAVANPGSDSGAEHDRFAFPLAFRTGPTGWQLTRGSAEMLLDFPPGQ